jgi:hypothetical protein
LACNVAQQRSPLRAYSWRGTFSGAWRSHTTACSLAPCRSRDRAFLPRSLERAPVFSTDLTGETPLRLWKVRCPRQRGRRRSKAIGPLHQEARRASLRLQMRSVFYAKPGRSFAPNGAVTPGGSLCVQKQARMGDKQFWKLEKGTVTRIWIDDELSVRNILR